MAAKSQNNKYYAVPLEFFADKMRKIESAGLRVALKSENPEGNDKVWFRLHHGTTFTSWGEKITVTLTRQGEGTDVHILSECGLPTQIIDWGKNASNVRAVFAYLEKELPLHR